MNKFTTLMGAIALVALAACGDSNSVAGSDDTDSSSSESVVSSSSSKPTPTSSSNSKVSSSSDSEVSSSSSKPTPTSSSNSKASSSSECEVSSSSESEPAPESSSESTVSSSSVSEPVPESSSTSEPITCLHKTSIEVLCFIAPETTSQADFKAFCAEENGTIGTTCPEGKTLECVGPKTGNTIYYYDEIATMMGCELMMSAKD